MRLLPQARTFARPPSGFIMLISSAATELLYVHLRARVPITDEDFRCLQPLLRAVSFDKKAHYLLEGDVCTHLAFVTAGCLRSYSVDAAGEEHTLQFAPEGWWISDLFTMIRPIPTYELAALMAGPGPVLWQPDNPIASSRLLSTTA